MIIEADSLQEAFSKAAAKLSCSVTQLDIKVLQHPRSGLFGMFKKRAIIEVAKEGSQKTKHSKPEKKEPKEKIEPSKRQNAQPRKERQSSKKTEQKNIVEEVAQNKEQNFREKEIANIHEVLNEISSGVKELVDNGCFNVEVKRVYASDDQTVFIEIDGEDAALLIGKEGYRYKAFSYLLYNWINIKYGLGIRLEIAQFLRNQEEMIENYLISVADRINDTGRGQTKPLDGVLIKIALEKLREKFPNKYVGIKTGREGRKFIVVNDFNRKQQ